MRKVTILILTVCMVFGLAVPAFAADPANSDMTWFEDVYYIDGTRHQIGTDSSGTGYYFINGVLQKGKGVVFINGSYYYVRTAGQLATGLYWATYSSVDVVPANFNYNYGSDFRMIDPPAYPDDWENEWAYEYPFPTDPPETEPPTDPPTDPVAPDPGEDPVPFSPVWGFDLMNQALRFATDIWSDLMRNTGLFPYFVAGAFLLMITRFLLMPILGFHSVSFGAGQSDKASSSRPGKYLNGKHSLYSGGGKYERR